jgi:hypothetical protein
MKKLILIQNDYSGAGKTTLSRCVTRYLDHHKTQHQTLVLSDSEQDAAGAKAWIDPSNLNLNDFVSHLDTSPITVLEVATGLGDYFSRFYQGHELSELLHEMGVEMTVVIPVTSEPDSHDAVVDAAETFSDNAQYAVAHLVTSSYEDDDETWDRSYAARVMDMFEAVELHIPELGFQAEHLLRAKHSDLAEALLEENPEENYGKDFTKWYSRVESQIDSARNFLFGDDFVAISAPAAKKTRKMARA